MIDQNARTDLLVEYSKADRNQEYFGFMQVWGVVVKMANNFSKTKNEHDRLIDLVQNLRPEQMKSLFLNDGLYTLCNLDPPLETFQAFRHENLRKTVQAAVRRMKTKNTRPSNRIRAICDVLKSIRDKRAHGFKHMGSHRDEEILTAGYFVISEIAEAVFENSTDSNADAV